MSRFEGGWEKANDSIDNNPPGLSNASSMRDQSPRRYGRSRTDTMVFSEAFNITEELSKSDERDRAGQSDDQHPADVVTSANRPTTEAVSETPPSDPDLIGPEGYIISLSAISLDDPPVRQLPVESMPSEIKPNVGSPTESTTPAPLSETTNGFKPSTPASTAVTTDAPETSEPVAEGTSTHERVDVAEPKTEVEVEAMPDDTTTAPEASEPKPTTNSGPMVEPTDTSKPAPAPADEGKAEEGVSVPATDSTLSEPANESTLDKTTVAEEAEGAGEKAEHVAPSAETEKLVEASS